MRETMNTTNTGPTPGPWEVIGGDSVMGPDGVWVAHVNRGRYCGEPQGWTRPEGTADARLIAAAPELLAFVERVACFHDARPEVTVCDLENSARDLLHRLSLSRAEGTGGAR